MAMTAYHEALGEFRGCRHDPRLLLERLGDVDAQAAHPALSTRLTLAGRLIAAAQVAERVRLPEPEVHAIVRAWLANREAERDDAAPAVAPRVAPEDESRCGFTHALLGSEAGGGFSRAAWSIAGVVLRHLIRPTMEVSRALSLRQQLEPLAAAALERLDELSPSEGVGPYGLLTRSAMRVRSAGDALLTDEADRHERREAWLLIGASVAQSHARSSDVAVDQSMARALARATERLASSLVPEQPDRFPQDAALEQAVQAAFDAAVTALGLAVQPADPLFLDRRPHVLDGLIEASSSALIGAWVFAHARD
jgi:hypothetical protein